MVNENNNRFYREIISLLDEQNIEKARELLDERSKHYSLTSLLDSTFSDEELLKDYLENIETAIVDKDISGDEVNEMCFDDPRLGALNVYTDELIQTTNPLIIVQIAHLTKHEDKEYALSVFRNVLEKVADENYTKEFVHINELIHKADQEEEDYVEEFKSNVLNIGNRIVSSIKSMTDEMNTSTEKVSEINDLMSRIQDKIGELSTKDKTQKE